MTMTAFSMEHQITLRRLLVAALLLTLLPTIAIQTCYSYRTAQDASIEFQKSEQVIQMADKALYRAKALGQNCVEPSPTGAE